MADSKTLPLSDKLLSKVYSFAQTVWFEKWTPGVEADWLDNFKASDPDLTERERVNMLFLLSKFMFFGSKELRELNRAIYRDLYKYPIVAAIRAKNGDTKNLSLIESKFKEELNTTKFVGVGNSSESGEHLLLYFRQEAQLSKRYFLNSSEIFVRASTADGVWGFINGLWSHTFGRVRAFWKREITNSGTKRYVFIDDFCGSGTQASQYLGKQIRKIKKRKPNIHISYFVLFGTEIGLEKVKRLGIFDSVAAVFTIDETFQAFSDTSRFFEVVPNATVIEKVFSKTTAEKYGSRLFDDALGFGDGQLLFGFSHNTPDNTLPVFWSETGGWVPVFKRYNKIY